MHQNWDKTRLENLIFFRAAEEESTIVCHQGKLKSIIGPSSALLKALLSIYNESFETENGAFIKREKRLQNKEHGILARLYRQERKKYPLQKSFYLTWAGKD